jgi:ATP-binding cassette subfamily A (ABC1) protein 3
MDKKLFFTKNDSMSLFNIIVIQLISIILMLSIAIITIMYKEGFLTFCSNDNEEEIGEKITIDSEDDKHLTQFEINHEEITETNKQLKQQKNYLNIKNVYKIFGDVKAVNNFNGEIFNNEIFCLLGHNGAGKTTLISMISGILEVDEGDIELNGISLIKNKKFLYENIGLCTQEDLYFKELTVKEHLVYMSELKGKKANNIEIVDLLNRLDLIEKADDIADHLSGGQKRKLCIALALIGKSKLILLDEPTSGMDVIAKKNLWEFLKNYKDDRILILTTHSLDEAEYLGDRIGIMNEGRYICSGTSSYLKSKYPCGFNINILIDSKISSRSKRMELYNKLKQIDNSAEVKIESKGVYSINFSNINDNINELFRIIDENKINCGIENYIRK